MKDNQVADRYKRAYKPACNGDKPRVGNEIEYHTALCNPGVKRRTLLHLMKTHLGDRHIDKTEYHKQTKGSVVVICRPCEKDVDNKRNNQKDPPRNRKSHFQKMVRLDNPSSFHALPPLI
ncbi:hypothetical protein EBO34_14480 [Alteribacter keqinensis]|uniref:Uncharacterized protein n=1 Tax=Alteribacter keqinensis TaxID=2483800 RepID=A0A3M7TQQ2_9BACI|nr:hypothetical protein EBO34_14480 [Alteribacter keqinensis]